MYKKYTAGRSQIAHYNFLENVLLNQHSLIHFPDEFMCEFLEISAVHKWVFMI